MQRIIKSPVYSLVRTDVCKLLMTQYNNTDAEQSMSFTAMTGITRDSTSVNAAAFDVFSSYTLLRQDGS